MDMLIKVTAVGIKTNISTNYFAEPLVTLVNPFKIFCAIPIKGGNTELRDESGRNTIIIKETPDEIYKLIQ